MRTTKSPNYSLSNYPLHNNQKLFKPIGYRYKIKISIKQAPNRFPNLFNTER